VPKVSEIDVAAVGRAIRHLILAGDHFRSALASQLHINVTELTALGHLIESDELTPKQLAQLLGITTGSVTGMVDHLESAGLTTRVPNPVDRRSVLVRPTPVAVVAMRGVYEQYHAALACCIESDAPCAPAELALLLEHAGESLSGAALVRTARPS